MAGITSTPGGTRSLLEDIKDAVEDTEAATEAMEARQAEVLSALKGIGYVLMTGQDVIGFEGHDEL